MEIGDQNLLVFVNEIFNFGEFLVLFGGINDDILNLILEQMEILYNVMDEVQSEFLDIFSVDNKFNLEVLIFLILISNFFVEVSEVFGQQMFLIFSGKFFIYGSVIWLWYVICGGR